ncbi:MAG: FtsL-like putative cell division protein [Mangrovibacterium sp.]
MATGKARNTFKSFLSGSILVRQSALSRMGYVAYIAVLLLFVVAHRYASEKTLREIDEVQKSIKEYRASSISYEAELMRINRPSLINEKVKAKGMEIHDPTEPPRELRVNKIEE